MKPTVLLASAAVVIAIGAAVLVSLPDRGATSGEMSSEELANAKLSQRDGTTRSAAADEKRPPVLGIRPTPGQPLGAEAIKELEKRMPAEHRASLAEARAAYTPSPEEQVRVEKQLAAAMAHEKLREDLRGAVTTFPETWTESYGPLMREYRDAYFAGPVTSAPVNTNPDTEIPTEADPTSPPAEELPQETAGFDLEEAIRLKEYYHSVVDNSLPRRYLIKSPKR